MKNIRGMRFWVLLLGLTRLLILIISNWQHYFAFDTVSDFTSMLTFSGYLILPNLAFFLLTFKGQSGRTLRISGTLLAFLQAFSTIYYFAFSDPLILAFAPTFELLSLAFCVSLGLAARGLFKMKSKTK